MSNHPNLVPETSAAGPIRNQQVIDEGKPDLVLAIQYKDTKTPGTQDMIRRAKNAGIRTEVIEFDSGQEEKASQEKGV